METQIYLTTYRQHVDNTDTWQADVIISDYLELKQFKKGSYQNFA